MIIKTKFHGEIEVSQEQILKFEKGVLGFEHLNEFIVLELDAESPFHILQSLQEEGVAFILTSPWLFEKDYVFDLNEYQMTDLRLADEKDLVSYAIVTIPKDAKNMTMNLVAPVVINLNSKLGMQVVLEGNNYTTKHLIRIEGA